MKKKYFLIGLFIFLFILCILFNFNQVIVYGIKENSYNVNNIIDANNEEITVSNEQKIVLEKINEEREKENLEPLLFRADLIEIAKQKAEDLVNNNYFSHTSLTYGSVFDMLRNNNINYNIAGENLAGAGNSTIAIEGWLNSPSHKDNILEEKYAYTGIYVIKSKVYGKIYVQIFLG